MNRATKATLTAMAAVAIAGAAHAEEGPCSEWREAGVIGDLQCQTTDGGAVIGGAARATEYAQVLPRAFATFAEHFAPSEQKVALVVQSEVSAELTAALAADDYKPLPWIDNEAKAAMLKESIVAQVEAQTASLPEAQRAAVVQQALAKAEGAAPATVRARPTGSTKQRRLPWKTTLRPAAAMLPRVKRIMRTARFWNSPSIPTFRWITPCCNPRRR